MSQPQHPRPDPDAIATAAAVAARSAAAAEVHLVPIDAGSVQVRQFIASAARARSIEPSHHRALDEPFDGSTQLSGAVREGELVGLIAGSVTGEASSGFASRAAVRPVADSSASEAGVLLALRWHQRVQALERGVTEIRWSTDPVDRSACVNAVFELGAQVETYREGRDSVPPSEGSGDVLDIVWPVLGPRVRLAADGRPAEPNVAALVTRGAKVVLASSPDGQPLLRTGRAQRAVVELPADIRELEVRDPPLAVQWRAAVRATLGRRLQQGERVIGATRRGEIVIDAAGAVEQLVGR